MSLIELRKSHPLIPTNPCSPMLAIGAIAERGKLGPIMVFVFVWSTIVYDPIAQLTAITPTIIIVLAALQLTSNDVHSRLTRSRTTRIFQQRPTQRASTMPLDTMDFAPNDAVLDITPKSPMSLEESEVSSITTRHDQSVKRGSVTHVV